VTLGAGGGRCLLATDVTLGGGARKCPPTCVVVDGCMYTWAVAGIAAAATRTMIAMKKFRAGWLTIGLTDWPPLCMMPPVYSNPLDAGKFLAGSGSEICQVVDFDHHVGDERSKDDGIEGQRVVAFQQIR
jgi:hypothetical protein